MAVKNWHFGKIVILWVCTILPIAVFVTLLIEAYSIRGAESLVIIFAAVLLALIFLVPITWKWLSGKEKRD